MDGAITPVTVRLIATAIERAQAERSQALILQLDTPGGLERSMRSIVQSILKSEIPVIVYVSPGGARAASAGVFITMAGDVAGMAPAPNIRAPPRPRPAPAARARPRRVSSSPWRGAWPPWRPPPTSGPRTRWPWAAAAT